MKGLFYNLAVVLILMSTELINGQKLLRNVLNDVRCHELAGAQNGDEVFVSYTGRFKANGKKFDSNEGPGGKPINYELGKGLVIQGWEEGLIGTCVGQRIKLDIPSELAYGSKGAGNGAIPPNSDLVFELTLVDLNKEIRIETTKEGDCSNDQKTRRRDKVTINYLGQIALPDNTLSIYDENFADNDLELTVGEVGVPGFDIGVAGACIGEERTVIVPPKLGYGSKGIKGVVPPNSTLVWNVKILKIEDRVLSFLDRISSGTFGK